MSFCSLQEYLIRVDCSSVYFLHLICIAISKVSMDKLPADQQAAIDKCISDRLRQTLLCAGEEAAVSTMDRGALKEAAAKQKLQGPA